jgi:hypothetical protein
MANALYDTGRAAFLNAGVNWTADNIKAVLVDTALYPLFNINTDAFLSDIPAGARIAISGNFAGKTSAAGVADATDLTFTAVGPAASVEALVIYKDTGVEGTSQLIAYIDVATGLPVTPSGGDILVVWDSGASKIFKL